MTFAFSAPGALWLLAALPLVWLARRYGRTNFNPRQQLTQAVVRSLLLAAIALAMARPVVSVGSSQLSVVYLVDVSHSIASRAIVDAAATIDKLNAETKPDHSRIVAFGADAVTLTDTAALRRLAEDTANAPAAEAVDRDGSDLERALAEARSELAPGHVPRIVLLSDGRETSGDVASAVTRLAAGGIAVFTAPLHVRTIGDAWVDAIQLPDRLSAGALVTVTVQVAAQKAASASIELRDGAKVLATKIVAVQPGITAVPVDVTFEDVGARVVEATVTVAGDPLAINNLLAREAVVRPRARVLYVEGTPASAKYLENALTQTGFDVTVRPPAGIPTDVKSLDPWDAVILSDVARQAIPATAMTALATWVEHEGGGLLVAGGDAVFGEGASGKETGYRRTELERLMPVTFERKDEPEVALIIVLDKSWSMAGQVMELCKAAAQAAIDVLADEQSVGVITFNDGFNWDLTLRNVGKNRDLIRKTVAAIEPSGHTLIFPAVEQAYNALKDARARAKHVVLLSDGRSYPDDYQGLVEKMVAAKMTVSTIAVGPAADAELLTNIAKWGKGRSYVVMDAKEVTQVFVKEAENATTPAFDEGTSIKPVLKARAFLEGIDLTKAPGLRGRTATVLKDTALELVATEDGDPLLAFWPIGLGRTAVFASDVKDRWATDWLRWRGYGPFFAALLHAIERQRPAALGLEVGAGPVRGDTRSVAVAVEARTPTGGYRDLLKPTIRVEAAGGSTADLVARQVAPGRYEANVIADGSRRLTVSVVGADAASSISRVIVPDPGVEYRFRPADLTALEAIARATGGKLNPTAADITNIADSHPTARRALWPALVFLALGLWLADILVRRIRFFEPAA